MLNDLITDIGINGVIIVGLVFVILILLLTLKLKENKNKKEADRLKDNYVQISNEKNASIDEYKLKITSLMFFIKANGNDILYTQLEDRINEITFNQKTDEADKLAIIQLLVQKQIKKNSMLLEEADKKEPETE